MRYRDVADGDSRKERRPAWRERVTRCEAPLVPIPLPMTAKDDRTRRNSSHFYLGRSGEQPQTMALPEFRIDGLSSSWKVQRVAVVERSVCGTGRLY
jgi:hypothetical protein